MKSHRQDIGTTGRSHPRSCPSGRFGRKRRRHRVPLFDAISGEERNPLEIELQHSAVDDGVAVTLDVDMTEVRELPPTPAGVRRMGNIEIAVPLGSRDHGFLRRFFDAQQATLTPMRVVAGDHTGLWSIKRVSMPPAPGDDLVRITLTYSGSA